MTVQSNADLIETVPYHQLFLSPYNVRKDESDLAIEELADLIAVEGVLQNLAGYWEVQGRGRTKKRTVGIVAGGRRYRAIGLLVEQKRVPPDFPVPCLVTTKDRAIAISLAENSGRLALHPADEFVAFRDLVNQGRSIEDVAATYHVKPIVVQRRLRLANVHAEFLDLYRRRVITMEHMMAFAVTDDTQRQQAAWKALPPGGRSASALRQLLTESEVLVSRPLAKFVGLEAYQAAGGAIRKDLFAECNEDSTYLVDAPLLQRLARAKLDAVAESLRAEAGAWIEVSPRLDFADLATYQHVQTVTRDPTPEEQATLDQIDNERGEIETQLFDLQEADSVGRADTSEEDETGCDRDDDGKDDGEEEDRDDALSPEERKLRDCLNVLDEAENTLRESFEVPDPAQAAAAGTLLSIGRDGELRVIKGLLKPEDAKKFAPAIKTRPEKKARGALGTTMTLRLSAYRTQALQAVLADRPKIALAALCHRMVISTLLHCDDLYKASLRIQVEGPRLENYADDLKDTKAYLALQSRRESWVSKLPSDPNLLLPWLLEQPDATVHELLALCTSISLDAIQSSESVNAADPIARATGLDMSDWWVPTASGYLGKIKKEQILEIVKTVVSPTEAARVEKMKKADMAKAAEAILANKRWLPAFYKTVEAA